MTSGDAAQAVRDAGCGWEQESKRLVLAADASPSYCNTYQCASLAAGAIRNGSTAEDVGAAALAYATGDSLAAELAAAGDHVGAAAARNEGKILMRAILAP